MQASCSPSQGFSPIVKKTYVPKYNRHDENDDSDNMMQEDSSEEDDFYPLAQKPNPTPPSSSQLNSFAGQCYCSQSEGSIHFFATQAEKIPFKLHDSQSQDKTEGTLQFSQVNSLQQFSQSNSQLSQRNSQFSQLSPTFSHSYCESEEYYGSQLSVSPCEWQVFAPENYRCVPRYTKFVLKQWREEEYHFEVKSLLEKQDKVDQHSRAILIDCMAGSCSELRVSSRALFLSVKILDIILSKEKLTLDNISLTSAACLSLAAKMENGQYPGADKYVREFDGGAGYFNENDLITREQEIFEIIDFNLTRTTIIQFLKYWLNMVRADATVSQIAMFVGVCSLLHGDLAMMKAEIISLGVIIIALNTRKLSFDMLKDDIARLGHDAVKDVCKKIIEATKGAILQEDSSIIDNFNSMSCSPVRFKYELPPL